MIRFLALCLGVFGASTAMALTAVFNSPTNVPVTAYNYTASNTLSLSLNFAPKPGVRLRVVDNTGLNPVSGTFTNLPEGSVLSANYGGDTFYFQLSYVGGTGNDITLTRTGGSGQEDQGSTITHFAGFNGHSGTNDGVGSEALFNSPQGMAIDAADNLYIADTGNYTIRKISPAGVVTTLAGRPGQYGSQDGMGSGALFSHTTTVAVDGSGNVLVADQDNQMIRRITPAGVVTTVVASYPDGTYDHQFDAIGVGVDASGGITIQSPSFVSYFGVGNSYATTWAGNMVDRTYRDGDLTIARFNAMSSLLVMPDGNCYVADSGAIRTLRNTGVRTFVGSNVPGRADGTGPDARFSGYIGGMSLDGAGNLLVADTRNHAIRRVTPAGVVTTLADKRGILGNTNGPSSAATLAFPVSVVEDRSGNLFVCQAPGSIRKITQNGFPPKVRQLTSVQNSNSIIFNALVTPNGFATTVQFTYGQHGAITVFAPLTVSAGNGTAEREVTASIPLAGLSGEGIYWFQCNATNVDGSVQSRGQDFLVRKPNVAPTDIWLYGYRDTDTRLPNTKVAEIVAVDSNWDDTFTYTLAAGPGDTNNDSFQIEGDELILLPPANFKVNSSYNIRVRATDDRGLSVEKQLPVLLTPRNDPPAITSAATFSVPENTTTVATVTATDSNVPAQPLTYSISGGADSNKFVINPNTGALSFLTAPNFEAPADAAGSNAYHVVVQLMNTGYPSFQVSPLSTNQAITVFVTNVAEPPVLALPTTDGIDATHATLGATVTDSGLGAVTERGVIYALASVNSNPQVNGPGVTKLSTAGTTGAFTVGVSGLSAGSAYVFRAYAINADGVGYGDATDFMTTTSSAIITAYAWTNYVGSTSGTSGTTDGVTSAARFNGPKGIVMDGNGDLFAADTLSHTIRKITVSSAAVTTQLGVAGATGFNDTVFLGATPKFNSPQGVTWDPTGSARYLIADTGNHTVRQATWTWLGGWSISTLAGSPPNSGSANGTNATARFNSPRGITVDSAGNIYVADTGNHTIRKVTLAGVVTTVAGLAGTSGTNDGLGSAARFNAPVGLAADGTNTLYVADTGNHTLRKIVLNTGTVTTLAGLAGSFGSVDDMGAAARFKSPSGITIDTTGRLFVTESSNHTVRLVTPDGMVKTVGGQAGASGLVDGTGPAARFNAPSGITVSNTTLYLADSGNNRVAKGTALYCPIVTLGATASQGLPGAVTVYGSVNPNSKLTAAWFEYGLTTNYGNPVVTVLATNTGTAAVAVNAQISGLAANTTYHYRVTATNADGTGFSADDTFTTSGGFQVTVATPDSVPLTAPSFNATGFDFNGVTLGFAPAMGQTLVLVKSTGTNAILGTFNGLPEGSRIPADYNGDRFYFQISYRARATANDIALTRVPGDGQLDGGLQVNFRNVNGAAADGLCFDSSNTLFAAHATSSHTITKDTAALLDVTIAGSMGVTGSTDGAGATARFRYPLDVVADSSDNIFVADSGNETIRKITPQAVVSTFAGLAGSAGSTDGTGSAARFSSPWSIAIDSSDNLFVVGIIPAVRKITPQGVVTTLAASLGGRTASVAVDSRNNIYVANMDSHIIQKITPAGVVSTFAGLSGTSGSADGTGSNARFNQPDGVAVGRDDTVYVSESGNKTIRRITPAGVVTIFAGQVGAAGYTNGSLAAARFTSPAEMAVDKTGTLYVSDTYLRKIAPSGCRPILTLTGATNASNGVVVGGTINPNGYLTTARFEWGLVSGFYFGSLPVTLPSANGTNAQNVRVTLTNLTGGNVYYYRLNATNVDGVTKTAEGSFTYVPAWNVAVVNFGSSSSTFVTSKGMLLDGASWNLTLGFAPVPGTVLKLLNNTSTNPLTGTFAGLPEGSLVPGTNGSNTYFFKVSYAGGDGNDITLTRTPGPGQVVVAPDASAYQVSTFAGTANTTGSADGTGSAASFNNPGQIARDTNGNLYVADMFNHTIRKITTNGVVTTLAGTAGISGTNDGTGTAASFNMPFSVVVDRNGNLFVADTFNHAIRKITPARVVTTVAGLAGTSGTNDGLASAARFNMPAGLAFSSQGDLYITEAMNNTV
ncbi:MAG: cadherin domain-containing protein, partial [Verrucomicrobiota bacterium]